MADWDALYISAVLRNKDVLALRGVSPDHLDGDDWRKVFEFVLDFFRTYSEMPTLGVVEESFELEFPTSSAPAAYYRDQIVKRRLGVAIGDGLEPVVESMSDGDSDSAFDRLRVLVTDLYREFKSGSVSDSIDFSSTMESRWEEYLERKNSPDSLGIATPWKFFNDVTGGLVGGELTFILAHSGVGKTIMALLMALNAMRLGHSVLVASQEMSSKQIAIRKDSLAARVEPRRLRMGTLTSTEEKRLREWYDDLGADHKLPPEERKFGHMQVLGPGDVSSIVDLEAAIELYKPEVVVWDSFYMLGGSQWEVQAELVAGMKGITGRRKPAFVATSQLNFATDTPTQASVSFTKRLFTDADFVFALRQDPEMKARFEMELLNMKARHGESLGSSLLNWSFADMDFSDKTADSIASKTNINDEVQVGFFKKSKLPTKSEQAKTGKTRSKPEKSLDDEIDDLDNSAFLSGED